MKTPHRVMREVLTRKVYAQWFANTTSNDILKILNGSYKSVRPAAILYYGFNWADSPEGAKYWLRVLEEVV